MKLMRLNECNLNEEELFHLQRWCEDTNVSDKRKNKAVLFIPRGVNPLLSSRFMMDNKPFLFRVAQTGYYSVEHYLQAAKVELLLTVNDVLNLGLNKQGLVDLKSQILNERSVEQAIEFTRKPLPPELWAQQGCGGQVSEISINSLLKKTSWYKNERFVVLEQATLYKFSQNPRLKQLLLSTSDALIVGLTIGNHPSHHTWGTAYENDRPGCNQLGRIPMSVRSTLARLQLAYGCLSLFGRVGQAPSESVCAGAIGEQKGGYCPDDSAPSSCMRY